MIILFAFCTKFDVSIDASNVGMSGQLGVVYPMFQDTHVMMLVGFGFLYTLLHRYSWSGCVFRVVLVVMRCYVSLHALYLLILYYAICNHNFRFVLSVALNFILTVLAIQWAIITQGFWLVYICTFARPTNLFSPSDFIL